MLYMLSYGLSFLLSRMRRRPAERGLRGVQPGPFPLVIQNNLDGLVRIIREREKLLVARADKFSFQQRFLNPLEQAAPVIAPDQDERKTRDAAGLHKCQHFKKLIERAVTARHKNKGDAVFDEANLARKEVM